MSKLERRIGNSQGLRDETGDDARRVSDSAGQSGDTQGISDIAEASDESEAELVDTAQDYEAELLEGLEDAADHPERPVHTHLDYGRSDDIPPEAGSE